jgi:hypothetical protein
MRILPQDAGSRREFFRATARYSLLALLSAVAGLAAKPRASNGLRCLNQGICGGCGIFPECGLPQALSVKRIQEKG